MSNRIIISLFEGSWSLKECCASLSKYFFEWRFQLRIQIGSQGLKVVGF
jgi:hypothetical protein